MTGLFESGLQFLNSEETFFVPPDASDESPAKPSWFQAITVGRNLQYTLIRLVILVVASVIAFHIVMLPIRVTGISMEPTYKDRAINFVNRFAYWHHEPQRGDVVGIRFAGIHDMYLKRIVGLPGETVGFENGHVVVNGNVLEEPYETNSCDWQVPPVQLAPDEYYVVGDNRTMPAENHVFGKTTRNRIIGKVVL